MDNGAPFRVGLSQQAAEPEVSALRASIPSAEEAAARAIAANKRGLSPDDPCVDGVWRSYVGQARAAIAAAGLEVEVEFQAMRKAALWLSQVAGGCEEVVCADETADNCHCFNRLLTFYRGTLSDARRKASAMSAGTAETQSGSGRQPASAAPQGETPTPSPTRHQEGTEE